MSNIDKDIEYINQDLDILINNIRNLPEITATVIVTNKQPLLLKFQSILVDLEKYKRLAEMNLKDSEEFKENMCKHRCLLKTELDNSISKDKVKEILKDLKVPILIYGGRGNGRTYAKAEKQAKIWVLEKLLEDK